MTNNESTTEPLDKKLGALFAQMREEDGMLAPQLPREMWDATDPVEVVAQREEPQSAIDLPVPWRTTGALAAAILVAVLMPGAPQIGAPGMDEIYLDVLQANTLLTDEVLQVSDMALPEMGHYVDMYDDLYIGVDGTYIDTYWN